MRVFDAFFIAFCCAWIAFLYIQLDHEWLQYLWGGNAVVWCITGGGRLGTKE